MVLKQAFITLSKPNRQKPTKPFSFATLSFCWGMIIFSEGYRSWATKSDLLIRNENICAPLCWKRLKTLLLQRYDLREQLYVTVIRNGPGAFCKAGFPAASVMCHMTDMLSGRSKTVLIFQGHSLQWVGFKFYCDDLFLGAVPRGWELKTSYCLRTFQPLQHFTVDFLKVAISKIRGMTLAKRQTINEGGLNRWYDMDTRGVKSWMSVTFVGYSKECAS